MTKAAAWIPHIDSLEMSLYKLSDDLVRRIEALQKGKVVNLARVEAEGLTTFVGALQGFARRLTGGLNSASVRFTRVCLVDAPGSENAFAYYDAGLDRNRHVVLVTVELLQRVREIAGQSQLVAKAFNQLAPPNDAFRALWGALPNDEAHLEAFGELQGYIVLSMLMHHEMAHIAFHHVACRGTSSGQKAAIDEREAASATNVSGASSALRCQATEVDADVHALAWTRDYIRGLANGLAVSLPSDEAATNAIWNAFLASVDGRRFLLVSSSWLLMLLFNPKAYDLQKHAMDSHPPATFRMFALLHAESQLAKSEIQNPSMQFEAADFAICIYAAMMGNKRILEAAESSHTMGLPFSDLPDFSWEEEIAAIGLGRTPSLWDERAQFFNKMAEERQSMNEEIERVRICPETAIVPWYGADWRFVITSDGDGAASLENNGMPKAT